MRTTLPPFVMLLFLCWSSFSTSSFAKLPEGFQESWVVKKLTSPVTFAFSPDGGLFICEQTGEIKVFRDNRLQDSLFLKLDVDSQGEHGLLGLVFDPQFELNRYVYVYYTSKTPYLHNRVSRFIADGDISRPNSEQVLLELDDLQGSLYHSAGSLRFGQDGKLYIGVGDNGGRPDAKNSQVLTNPFGKILRINSDGTIPEDNPFYQAASGMYRSIWALGFRNPFTLAFQPGTSRLFVNDVGADNWEEINDGKAGANYGWPDREGQSNDSQYLSPIYSYGHGAVTDAKAGCAITGGVFYNPAKVQFPKEFLGKYFFIDYCSNWIRVLNPTDNTVIHFGTGLAANPVSLELGPDGNLYYMSRWLRGIYRIAYDPPTQGR